MMAGEPGWKPPGVDARRANGFELVEPGLVFMPRWRPDSPGEVPTDPGPLWGLVGVAREP